MIENEKNRDKWKKNKKEHNHRSITTQRQLLWTFWWTFIFIPFSCPNAFFLKKNINYYERHVIQGKS